MNIDGKPWRTIWLGDDERTVKVIDQRKLPFEFEVADLRSVDDVATAIREMYVRGAGLIGATAGWGMHVAVQEAAGGESLAECLRRSGDQLIATRPTAINLRWAVERQLAALAAVDSREEALAVSKRVAETIADEDAEMCRQIGQHGLPIIEKLSAGKVDGQPVNILTHCNAGWLAFVDHGSATAPIYAAHDAGIPVHVWVDETRPRNQGARLTAWELNQHGVPHTVIPDNVGGHLMQHGMVDLVITGTDRTTHTGDVCNKIGTYLKALAARDNDVPFYVALPSSTFDWETDDGVREIPIEERGDEEVRMMDGVSSAGNVETVDIISKGSPAANYAFDVTPRSLITGLICERGVCTASQEGIHGLFPER